MPPTADAPSQRRFAIAQLALIVPWIALVIDAWGPIVDNSFLWHIRAGELQASAGAVLQADPFSFTVAGAPWLTQSWLVEILYAWLEGLAELAFVPWMIIGISSLTFLAIGLVAYRFSGNATGSAFVLVLSTIALLSFMVPRPVLFSYLLMILVVLAWDVPRMRWSVPFLFWLWAAIHGSFAIGLAYIGLTALMKRQKTLVPPMVVSGVATLFTAHGLGVITFLLRFGETREALGAITEWRDPSLFEPVFLPIVGGVLFIVIGAFRGLILPKHLWVLVPFLLLAMTAVRAIPPAWIALIPLVSIALQGLTIGTTGRLRAPLAAVFGLAVFALPLLLIRESTLDDERFPVNAVEALTDVPTFHDDRTGGFLIWAEGPERQVYIDDRAELYGERLGEFVRVRTGEESWEPVFERDGIEQALLANSDSILIEGIRSGGWSVVYADETFTVLRP
jgi:hypothetical protein